MTKYIVREATKGDIPQLINLVVDCLEEIYPDRDKSSKLIIEFTITRWITNLTYDIIVVDDGVGNLLGFSTGTIDSFDTLLKPFYMAILAFVEKKHRKGKATWLIYDWMAKKASKLGIVLEAVALTDLAESHLEKFGAVITGKHMITHRFVKELHAT